MAYTHQRRQAAKAGQLVGRVLGVQILERKRHADGVHAEQLPSVHDGWEVVRKAIVRTPKPIKLRGRQKQIKVVMKRGVMGKARV
eukprot:365574-Chlamydomonas_euryale.AAC.26